MRPLSQDPVALVCRWGPISPAGSLEPREQDRLIAETPSLMRFSEPVAPMGKEPEVADARKAGGNHVLKESRQNSS